MENSEAEATKDRKLKTESKPSQLPSIKADEQAQEFPERKPLNEVQQSCRERGQRDLFYFCKEILGYKDMLTRVHQPVCDIYGPSDPLKPIEEQSEIKNFLILDPRGTFKTSISIGKTIQNWVNFPDVAMLRMSGKEELVKRTIGEVLEHLTSNSRLRELYPEAVPWSTKKGEEGLAPSSWGTAYGITHPKRSMPRREPTLAISTLESVKSGSHYEWVTGDDLVHEKNYQTRELLTKTILDWDLSRNLLNPRKRGNYRELDGTRYDWSDLYGKTMETNRGAWRIHCRPIWTNDLKYAQENGFYTERTFRHPELGELYLLIPELWSLEELLEIQNDNPYLFNCQRLNNPIPAAADNFPMTELIKRTITRDKYPDTGLMNIFMAWFFNLADAEAEPAVGVVAGWDAKGRLFIIDLAMGQFKPSVLIDNIIAFWHKWPISRIAFEDNKRQRLLEPGLMARLRQLKLSFAIDWVKFGGNNQSDDDMINQVLALEPLLRENQLWFHAELPHLTNLYLQFSRFPKFKLRGIPYAISRLMFYRTQATSMTAQAIYGSELYSPALSWDRNDESLGAGLVG